MTADDLLTIKCCDTLTIDQNDVLEMQNIICYGKIISKGVIYFDSLVVTDDGIPPVIVDHAIEVYVVQEGVTLDFLHNISYSDVMCENVSVKIVLKNQTTFQEITLSSKTSNLRDYDLSNIPSGDWTIEYYAVDCKDNESSPTFRTLRIIDDDFWLRIVKYVTDASNEYKTIVQVDIEPAIYKEERKSNEYLTILQVTP